MQESNFIWQIFVVQIMIILILIGIILVLFRTSKAIRYEKRIGKFAISSIISKEKSFFDHITEMLWNLNHHVAKLLEKSVVLQKYGTKFEKYILYEEREIKSGLDYIAMKFLIGIALVLLNVLTVMFQYIPLNAMTFLITFLIGFFLPDIALKLEYAKKRKQIEEDLLKAIIIMNNAFKSGRNIMQAIEIVKTELTGPISDEFKKIYLDITYGLSLEVVFGRFYQRVKLDDAKYIASSLTLLNKTGGNIVKVFASIEKSFFDKKKLRNELKSMTSSSVFVFRVLVCLPFIFAAIIFILNPSYFMPLFKSALGLLILGFILLLFVIYILVVKKVLKVEI